MSRIFEPLKIGNMDLKNRIAMAPMSLGFESQDGTINEKMSDYWEARAKGGTGLIIMDVVTVDSRVPYLGNTTNLSGPDQIQSLKKLTDKVHSHGGRIIPQISHPGPESISGFFGVSPVGPSIYPNSFGHMTKELSVEEIKNIIKQYGQTAKNAREAGCDGVELHCAHAYMLAGSFLSPLRNKRGDMYGGSLDNRARFVIEAIRSIKEDAGEDFPIILRISGDEKVKGGNTLEDMLYLLPKLIDAGVDAFEVSGGSQYELPWKIIPCHGEDMGSNIKEAAAIKKVSTVPVFVVGKILDPRFAEHVIESNYADGVVMGRALLADPNLSNKAKEGLFEDISPCVGCGLGCIGEQSKQKPGTCIINPAVGRENELALHPAEKKKKVVVIGGGPSGLEVARVSALRGHEVILIEKEAKLGGQLNLASIPPHKQSLSKWVVYLVRQVEKAGVEIKLNTKADSKMIADLRADVIIVATGGEVLIPPIKGIEEETVSTGHDIISGKKYYPQGNILVVGGGMVGCEVIEKLFEDARGKMNITIVELLEDIGMDDIPNNKLPMINRLLTCGVEILTETKVKEIVGSSVIVERNSKEERLGEFDGVVLACGTKSVNGLVDEAKKLASEVYVIGDASSPRKALEAVAEGYEIGRNI